MSKSWNYDQAPKDRIKLSQLRKPRDKRLKAETLSDKLDHEYMIKRTQFDLVLHSRGMVSPFDYEYPRLNQMSKLAQAMYDKHLKPRMEACMAEDQRLEDEECALYGE